MLKAEVRHAGSVGLTDADRHLLAAWIRAGTTPQRVVKRARIVLLAAEGMSVRAIAHRLQTTPRTVIVWRRRFEHHGADALWRDAPGRGRKRSIGVDAASRVRALLETAPPKGDRWSIRTLAHAAGLSRASVHRIVRTFRSETGTGDRWTRTRGRQLAPRTLLSAEIPV